MKKTRIRTNSRKESAKLQRKLWPMCRQLVRKMYQNPAGDWDCYTCGRLITNPRDAHTAHMIPKSTCGAYLKYDIRNLRICCYNCNVNLGGNGALFMKNMIIREGNDYVEQIFRDKSLIVKGLDRYQYLYEKYSLMLEGRE